MEINLECSDIFNDEYSQFMDNNSQICLNVDEDNQGEVQQVMGENNQIQITATQKGNENASQLKELEEIPPQSSESMQKTQKDVIKDYQEDRSEKYKKDEFLELSEIQLDQSQAMDVSISQDEKRNDSFKAENQQRTSFHAPVINFQFQNITKKAPVVPLLKMKPPQVPSLNLPTNKQDQFKLNSTQSFPFTMTQGSTDTKNSQQPLSSTATSTIPINKQWQKVTISKRRQTPAQSQESGKISSNNQIGQRSTSTSVINKPKLPINMSNIQNSDLQDNNYPRTYREKLIASPCVNRDLSQRAETQTIASRRRKTEPGEILPLFDCLFCCQEHFVLAKQSENTMSAKYVKNPQHFDEQRGYLFVDLLMKERADTLALALKSERLEPHIEEQAQVKPISSSLTFISQIENYAIKTPILSKVLTILKGKNQTNNYLQKELIAPSGKIPLEGQSKVLNIADELNNSDSQCDLLLNGSRAMNIKTRRQRIVENISFETDCFNIYDPYFTSEDESSLVKRQRDPSTSSIDSLHTSQEECYIQQQHIMLKNLSPVKQLEKSQLLLDVSHSKDGLSQEIDYQILIQPESVAKLLNIQENKFTPDQCQQDLDKDSQRYTFGCITPKGVGFGALNSNLQSNKGIFNQISSGGAGPGIHHFRGMSDPLFLIDRDSQGSPLSSRDENPSQLRIPQASIQYQDAPALLQLSKDDQLPEVQYIDPIMSADQSPISQHGGGNYGRTIQDFSPVTMDMAQRIDCEMPNELIGPSTGKQLSRIKEQISKINFYPAQPLMESLEMTTNQANLTRIRGQRPGQDDEIDLSLQRLGGDHQPQVPMRNKVIHAPHQSVGGQLRVYGDKESCFSPIQHDNSLSREGAYAAAAVREAIQGHYFNTGEDEYDITLAQENEYQTQSNNLFGEKEIAMTSKFPNHFDFQGTQNEYFTGVNEYQNHFGGTHQHPQSQFIMANQSQSFSAFNSKHLDNHNPHIPAHQSPQTVLKPKMEDFQHPNVSVAVNMNTNNLITETEQNSQEPCSTARGKKKNGKKFLIKQDQLSILLQKALEKKNSQTVSNILQDNPLSNNTLSSDFMPTVGINIQHSLYDSIIKHEGGVTVGISTQQIIQNQSSQNESTNANAINQHQVSLNIDNINPVIAMPEDLLQNGQANSQKNIVQIPKHKKKQKTYDFNKPQHMSCGAKTNYPVLNTHQSAVSLNDKKVPKVPGTTVGQNTRKVSQLLEAENNSVIQSQKYLLTDQQVSRQPAMSQGNNRFKNYHQSFNNVIGSSQAAQRKLLLELNPDVEDERPMTFREGNQEDIPDKQLAFKFIQKNLHNLALSPNLFFKASKNMIKKPPQMTREEMAQYLKSAICSSRYSSSSIVANPHLFQGDIKRQLSLDSKHRQEKQHNNSQQRFSNSAKKRLQLQKVQQNESEQSPKRRERRHVKNQGPLMTEVDYQNNHDHLSIDQQTTLHKMSADKKYHYVETRRDSQSRGTRSGGTFGNKHANASEAQRLRLKKVGGIGVGGQNANIHQSSEKRMERAATGKQNYKSSKAGQSLGLGSKERKGKDITKKYKNPKQEQNLIEFQSYLNLCNSINFSNDISLAKPTTNQGVSTSLISHSTSSKPLFKKDQGLVSTSLIHDGNFTTKGGYYNSNAQNSSSILVNGAINNLNYHNSNQSQSNLNLQDSSQNIHPSILLGNAPITHISNNNVFLGNEMSTTISGNQLSLTRMVSGGDSRPAIKGNQTISSGPVNITTGSGGTTQNMNQTTVINSSSKNPKVIVPALQLNRIKSNSTKRKQLNGSHDEIQLQNLLLNLNQHLQANQQQMQTRASLLKDGSNTVTTTPHGAINIASSFQRGIAAAAAAAQSTIINTKRSQGSSLSLQRQSMIAGGVSAEAPRKESLDRKGVVTSGNLIKHLNQTAQHLKKKQDGLALSIKTAIQTAVQKDRRKKSKDNSVHPPLSLVPSSTKNQVAVSQEHYGGNLNTKKILQNSFTLKTLKMMTQLQTNVAASQQLTGRIVETQRETERNLSNNNGPRQQVSAQQLVKQKTSNSQKRVTSKKGVKTGHKEFSGDTSKSQIAKQAKISDHVPTLNRSSLCPQGGNFVPGQLQKQRSGLNLNQVIQPHSSSTLNLSALLLQQRDALQVDDIAQSARCFYDTTHQTQNHHQTNNKLSSPVAGPRVLLGLGAATQPLTNQIQVAKVNNAKNFIKNQHKPFSLKSIFAKKQNVMKQGNKQRESLGVNNEQA